MSSSSPYLFTYRIIYTPHHRQVEKQLVILLVPRRITDGKHLLLYIVPQKLKKVNQTFLYFNRYTMYLYYITQLSVLCYCNLITNSSCKKSQNHFVRLVSSSPFSPILSTKSGRNSTGTLGDKIFHCIVWKKFLKLTVELCRQSLVVCDDQCRFI